MIKHTYGKCLIISTICIHTIQNVCLNLWNKLSPDVGVLSRSYNVQCDLYTNMTIEDSFSINTSLDMFYI